MPQSLVQVYLHVVFSTKDRQPFLREQNVRTELHAYLAGTCKNLGVDSLQVGGVEDHVHLCCRLSKTLAISDLIAELKRESSKWIKPRAKDGERPRRILLATRLRRLLGQSISRRSPRAIHQAAARTPQTRVIYDVSSSVFAESGH